MRENILHKGEGGASLNGSRYDVPGANQALGSLLLFLRPFVAVTHAYKKLHTQVYNSVTFHPHSLHLLCPLSRHHLPQGQLLP